MGQNKEATVGLGASKAPAANIIAYFHSNGRDFLADGVPAAEANMAPGLTVGDKRQQVPEG